MSDENEPITLTPSPSMELSTSISTDNSKSEELNKSKDQENQILKQNISLIYGNDYKLKNPKKLGNSFFGILKIGLYLQLDQIVYIYFI